MLSDQHYKQECPQYYSVTDLDREDSISIVNSKQGISPSKVTPAKLLHCDGIELIVPVFISIALFD